MHIRAEHIDADIQRVSHYKGENKDNHAERVVAGHGAHLIEDRSDNAGCKAESQKSRVRENIA